MSAPLVRLCISEIRWSIHIAAAGFGVVVLGRADVLHARSVAAVVVAANCAMGLVVCELSLAALALPIETPILCVGLLWAGLVAFLAIVVFLEVSSLVELFGDWVALVVSILREGKIIPHVLVCKLIAVVTVRL